MAIPANSRWWIATLLIVGVLILISALALDRPDVIWAAQKPHCPDCRHEVSFYSHRCPDCRGEFDWVIASVGQSPISPFSFSVLEAEWVRERVAALGPAVAAKRVASATGLSDRAAEEYLGGLGRGDCGWCGGSKLDLSQPDTEGEVVCIACLGTGNSVDCAGDRRVRLGDQGAHRSLEAYRAAMDDLSRGQVPAPVKATEARRLAEDFLSANAGSVEAREIIFWPSLNEAAAGAQAATGRVTIVEACRRRLDQVIEVLRRSE